MPPQSNPYTNQEYSGTSTGSKKRLKYIVLFALLAVALISITTFAIYSFMKMQDYKNNSDQISAEAVEKAKTEQAKILQEQFAQAEKEPLKSYTSPSQYGSVKIVYPKTWSAYVIEFTNNNNVPVDGYFYPDFVPGTNSDKKSNYALRLQISSGSYKNELDQYKARIDQGKLKAVAYKPESLKDATVGVRLDGQITYDKKGSMVVLPLRDKILKIWTENEANTSDFNNFVLKNLSYSP